MLGSYKIIICQLGIIGINFLILKLEIEIDLLILKLEIENGIIINYKREKKVREKIYKILYSFF